MVQAVTPAGRRERNKQDKLARIHQAGVELFEARGVSAVTTQEIASRAGIGTGTLFQYVSSKAELLVMIYNQYFQASIRDGWAAQAAADGVRGRVLGLLGPVVACHRRHPENGRAYLHEIVYGPATERYRGEAISLVQTLQDHLEEILLDTGVASTATAAASARVVFAVMFLTLSDAQTADAPAAELLADIDRLLATHFPHWSTEEEQES